MPFAGSAFKNQLSCLFVPPLTGLDQSGRFLVTLPTARTVSPCFFPRYRPNSFVAEFYWGSKQITAKISPSCLSLFRTWKLPLPSRRTMNTMIIRWVALAVRIITLTAFSFFYHFPPRFYRVLIQTQPSLLHVRTLFALCIHTRTDAPSP